MRDEVMLIDTPGIGDPDASEAAHLHNMKTMLVETIQKNYEGVTTFCLVFNGTNPRFDQTLQHLVHIFISIFGSSFLKNVILVHTSTLRAGS